MQPPASEKALADPLYEAFYGLTEEPFSITTDPKFFYLSASHEPAYHELLNGLKRREGLLVLTGETGTGKTTLSRAVIQGLGPRTFAAMVLNPYMSGPEVFRVVLRDFGLVSHEDLRRGVLASADVSQLLDTLEGFLRSLMPLDAHAVIVLDEAQSVSPETLDQLRLLTSLEQDNKRLVQIVLCGQPGLLKTLTLEPMHALNERITRRVALAPLPPSEVQPYIDHRLRIAGGAESVTFDATAARLVADLSHGLPRRINVLCDRALQEGRAEGATVISGDVIKRAARAVAGAQGLAETPEAPDASVTNDATLSFGQTEEPARGVRFRRLAYLIGGAVAAAAVLAWGWSAYRAVADSPAIIPVAGPALDVGTPVAPLAVPADAAAVTPTRRTLAPQPPVAATTDVTTAPRAEAAPAPAPTLGQPSAQIPGNSN